jgi:CRP/FNR family cyclic AMP-dependent transcriptional regulator
VQGNPFMVQDYQTGDVILKEGQPNECLYAINSGRVEVSKGSPPNKTVVVELGVGDLFGEMGLIDGLPASATVTALEPTSVWLYDDRAFREAVEHDSAFAKSIVDMLVTRLRQTTNQLQMMIDSGKDPKAEVSQILDQHPLI